MSKMRAIDLWHSILSTKVSFIALILFVSLSIGDLLGMNWTGPAVTRIANDYYDRFNAADMVVSGADGFTDEDIENVRALEDILAVQGIKSVDAFISAEDEEKLINITSVSHDVNKLEVLEGRLPEDMGEIALDRGTAEEFGYTIGDTMEIDSSMQRLIGFDVNALKDRNYKICGIIHHPLYIADGAGAVKGFSSTYGKNFCYYGAIDESEFDTAIIGEKYTQMLIRSKSLEGADRFADDYGQKISKAADAVTDGIEISGDFVITDITTTFGYYYVTAANDSGGKFGAIIGVFFFVIGLLVCFSTILRIVEGEVRLIGTKLANGFNRMVITTKYMWYTVIAVALGSVLGIGIALYVSAFGQVNITNMMAFEGTINYIDPVQLTLVIALEFAAMILITILATGNQLRKSITNLLTSSKDNSPLFTYLSRLPIIKRSAVDVQSFIYNISMDGSRVFATIVGMVGSIALLIGSISLYSISDTARVQYEKIFLFDHSITYNSQDAQDKIQEILSEKDTDHVFVRMEDGIISREDEKSGSVKLIITDDPESLGKLVKFKDTKGGKAMSMDNDGIFLYQTEQRDYGVNPGDTVSIKSYDGGDYKFKVSGVYENHDSSSYRIFMTREVYEKVSGKDYESNACMTRISDDTAEEIRKLDGVLDCNNDKKICSDYVGFAPGLIDGMVAVTVFLSALIAFLILLNLNIQFVQEKKMEIIVMRINGFSIGAARKYIIRDNVLLSVISSIIGVIAGVFYAKHLIDALQMEGQVFINKASPKACIIGVGLTLLYMLITTVIAVKPISKFDLTDITKM